MDVTELKEESYGRGLIDVSTSFSRVYHPFMGIRVIDVLRSTAGVKFFATSLTSRNTATNFFSLLYTLFSTLTYGCS